MKCHNYFVITRPCSALYLTFVTKNVFPRNDALHLNSHLDDFSSQNYTSKLPHQLTTAHLLQAAFFRNKTEKSYFLDRATILRLQMSIFRACNSNRCKKFMTIRHCLQLDFAVANSSHLITRCR